MQNDKSLDWFGYIIDISLRKLEEKNLLASVEKFKFISENTSNVIVVLENKSISNASKSYAKLFNYSEKELYASEKKDVLNIIHPEDSHKLIAVIDEVVNKLGEKLVFEYRYLHKNGNCVWREDTFSFFYDENGNNFKQIIVARNILDQKKIRIDFNQTKSMLEQTSYIAKVIGYELDMATKQIT